MKLHKLLLAAMVAFAFVAAPLSYAGEGCDKGCDKDKKEGKVAMCGSDCKKDKKDGDSSATEMCDSGCKKDKKGDKSE